ncbi:MAG: MlaD family protein, partial [Phycisphaerae bacterium]|nr:MlaD family protein [Phycisphaerae bacterium]
GWLIIKFGTQPRAFSDAYALTMRFPSAGTLASGSEVRCAGVLVGHVRKIDPQKQFLGGVRIVADIETKYSIPADSRAVINTGGLTLAKQTIELVVNPTASAKMLTKDGKAELPGEVVSGFEGLIPADVREQTVALSRALIVLSEDLHTLFRPQMLDAVDTVPTTGPDGRLVATTQPLANLSTVVQRMDITLRRMTELLDARNGDVSVFLANMRAASENAKDVTTTLKTFAQRAVVVADDADKTFATATAQLKRIGDSLAVNSVQLAGALDKLNKSLGAIADGKGTAGRLINDPALYENMLLASDRLHKTIIELQDLVKQWKADGVRVKLK